MSPLLLYYLDLLWPQSGRDILILTSSRFFLLHLRAHGGDAPPSPIWSQALPGNWCGLDPSSFCSRVRPCERAENSPCIACRHRRPRLLWRHAEEDRTNLRADRLCGVPGEVSFIYSQLEKGRRSRSLGSRSLPTQWSEVPENETSKFSQLSFELFLFLFPEMTNLGGTILFQIMWNLLFLYYTKIIIIMMHIYNNFNNV